MTDTFRGLVELQVDDVIAEGQFVVALGHVVLQADDGTTSRVAFNDVRRFRDGRIVDLRAFAVPI
jgi:ketosteroid isomerase-like protein